MSTFQASKINASNYYTNGGAGYLAPASGTPGQVLYRLGGPPGVGWTGVSGGGGGAGATGAFQQLTPNGPVELVQTYGSSFNVNVGDGSIGENWVTGAGAVAMGAGNTGAGAWSITMGTGNEALNMGSVAIGSGNAGLGALAIGWDNVGSAGAVAIGQGNTACGQGAVAMGIENEGGVSAVAIGAGNIATGLYSVAMGQGNTGEGNYSVAMGLTNHAVNQQSVAMGWSNTTGGNYSVAMGQDNETVSGAIGSFAMGGGNTAGAQYSAAVGVSNETEGDYSVAMGFSNTASGWSSVAMGHLSKTGATGAVAMGQGNTAAGDYCVAMGYQNTAGGTAGATGAVAMGRGNTAGGEYSVVMGYDNSTSSQSCSSVAIGQSNTALGEYTIAMGYGCAASDSCAVALGRLANAGETAGATGIGFAFGGGTIAGNCFTITNNNNLLPIGGGTFREAPGFVGLNLDPGLDMNATPNGNYPLFIGDHFAQGGTYPQFSSGNYYKLPANGPVPGGNALWSAAISTAADNVGIYIDNSQWIYTGGGLINPSDERIKENITTLDTSETLEKIRTLRPVSYTLIKDRPNPYLQYGYIAQEVKELLPQAVGPALKNEWICSEMRLSTDHSWSGVTGVTGYNAKLTIHDLEGSTGNQLYRFYVADDEEEQKKEVAAEESDPKSFLFDSSYNKVFIWGKQVNDFHTLDYTKVNTFAIPAIQELDKQLTAEKAKNAKLEARLAALEERVTTLESN